MPTTTFRTYRGPEDVDAQYELWLSATDGLPYAWRSNLKNARFVSGPAADNPGARIYAERDGVLVGYIGTHPPVEWDTGEHLIPFGFPWTYPINPALEAELYDRMLRALPNVYPNHGASACVQRFRGSWTRQLGFLQERGWQHRWRNPILSRPVDPSQPAPPVAAQPLTRDRLSAIHDFAADDPAALDVPDVPQLERRLAGGWLELESLWEVPDCGVFEMEVRPPWGEVRLFYARPKPDTLKGMWHGMSATALRQGARDVYLAVEEKETARREQLLALDFLEADAGVYLTLPIPAAPA